MGDNIGACYQSAMKSYTENLATIARIMSEKAGCEISADDIRADVCTQTTTIYTAVRGTKIITCKERKPDWRNKDKYEVVVEEV